MYCNFLPFALRQRSPGADVKPNYPGRSSHICNAGALSHHVFGSNLTGEGFVVPTTQRGLRLGLALGRSYLYYAPRLGYRASVLRFIYI